MEHMRTSSPQNTRLTSLQTPLPSTLLRKKTGAGSFSFGNKEGVAVGADGEVAIDSKQLNNYSAGVSFLSKELELAALGKFAGKNKNFVFNVWYVVPNAGVNVAAELNYDGASTPSLKLGLERKLFQDVTGKLRWTNNNHVALSLVTKVNSATELTFAQEIDFATSSISKIGFTLSFK